MEMLQSLKTGESAFRRTFGAPVLKNVGISSVGFTLQLPYPMSQLGCYVDRVRWFSAFLAGRAKDLRQDFQGARQSVFLRPSNPAHLVLIASLAPWTCIFHDLRFWTLRVEI